MAEGKNALITATLHYCGDKCLLVLVMSGMTTEKKAINHSTGPVIAVRLKQFYSQSIHPNAGTQTGTTAPRRDKINIHRGWGVAGKILSPPDYESTHHKQPMIRSATGQQAALAAVNGQICNVLLGARSISAAHESSQKVSCGHREWHGASYMNRQRSGS